MSIGEYSKTIEEFVSKKHRESSGKESNAKGLLAPKGNMDIPVPTKQEAKQQQDMVTIVGEFVYALRQKRAELKSKRKSKNGS